MGIWEQRAHDTSLQANTKVCRALEKIVRRAAASGKVTTKTLEAAEAIACRLRNYVSDDPENFAMLDAGRALEALLRQLRFAAATAAPGRRPRRQSPAPR